MQRDEPGAVFCGLRVLIVEDSATQALKLRHVLERAGCSVLQCGDGANALAMLETMSSDGVELPDALISDVLMPLVGGYALCQRLKADARWQEIPVMLLTALGDPGDLVRGLESGADIFVVKPFDAEHLLTQLAYLVQSCATAASVRGQAGPDGDQSDSPGNFNFAGQDFQISADVPQVLRFLVAAYEEARHRTKRLQEANQELREAHEELATKNMQLEKLNATKNQFLGMAAHDLRNPLDVIRGYTEFITEEAADRLACEELRMLDIVRYSSNSMLALVNDLLDVTQIEAGTLNLELELTDPVVFARQSVFTNRIFAERKGIDLEFEADTELLPVWIDPRRAEQVLGNLIGNAVKFSHSGTSIMVSVRRSGQPGPGGPDTRACPDTEAFLLKVAGGAIQKWVEISVQDQGPGIAPEELEHIFQPFRRSTAVGTAGESSTGLGLAIVRKIVECHGGTISVESRTGTGSIFRVVFPAATNGEK